MKNNGFNRFVNIVHVVGARPNFMKLAPVWRALSSREGVRQKVIHTGQHYDVNMSDVFFRQLEMRAPDLNLAVGPGTQTRQTAEIMMRLEPAIAEYETDLALVYGDVNSTVAAALVCAKLGVRTGHVEAGLRSFDRGMPEEINRIVTDQLADLLFTPSADGDNNLEREGISPDKIFRVGNVMIDSLVRMLPVVTQRSKSDFPQPYALVTLHRAGNVDDVSILQRILKTLDALAQDIEIIFPAHPRTRTQIATLEIELKRLRILDPMPYIDFLAMETNAAVVITDSGGVQEETTYLGIPCLTVRDNTERPITVSAGTNILVGRDMARLRAELFKILDGKPKKGFIPPLWDGKASERIVDVIVENCYSRSNTLRRSLPRLPL